MQGEKKKSRQAKTVYRCYDGRISRQVFNIAFSTAAGKRAQLEEEVTEKVVKKTVNNGVGAW